MLLRSATVALLGFAAGLSIAILLLDPKGRADEAQRAILEEYVAAFCRPDMKHDPQFVIGSAATLSRLSIRTGLGSLALLEYAKCRAATITNGQGAGS